ncbi:MAG: hypothetical protein RIG84_08580 [Roseovarius sp.]
MVYIVPLFCFVIPLIVGVLAIRAERGWLVALFTVLLALLMAWAIWKGRQMQGWDGMGYAIVAMLMAAPGILGLLLGAAIGWVQRVRARRSAE